MEPAVDLATHLHQEICGVSRHVTYRTTVTCHASRNFRTSAPRRREPAVHTATTPRPCQGVSGRLFTLIVAWASRPAGRGPICCKCRARVALEMTAAAV